MSEENVEVLRRGFDAFQRGGPEALLELFSDNAITYRHEPDRATLHGKAGFRDAVADWTEDFSEWQVLPKEFTDLGERVLVRVLQIAHGRSSGVRVEEDWWFLFELTDSKISKLSFYSNPADALEAAVLSEQAMSEENVEVMRRLIDAFNDGGIDAVLPYVHPDIAWYAPAEWLEKRVYHGHEELRELASFWRQNFENYRLDLDRAVALDGGRVLAFLHQRGRVRGGGLEVDQDIGYLAELDGGTVVRVDVYFSWDAALEAAGLSE